MAKPKNAQDYARWIFKKFESYEVYDWDPKFRKEIAYIKKVTVQEWKEEQRRKFNVNYRLAIKKSDIEWYLGENYDESIKAVIDIEMSDDQMWNFDFIEKEAAQKIQLESNVEAHFGEYGWNVITFHKDY